MYAFLLSKENLKLSIAEVLALTNAKKYRIDDNLLIIDIKSIKNLEKRLAQTYKIYELLFETTEKSLTNDLQNYNWSKIYNKDFWLRIHSLDKPHNYSEAKLAGYIWRGLKNPKVNLTDAETKIELLLGKKIYCCLLKAEIEKSFFERKAHLKPELMPTSLNPRLAKSLINILGVKKGDTLLDPCCGSGGMLVEAGLMGIKTIGYDISEYVLNKARKNLDYYKIKNCKLIEGDALKIRQKYDYIIADLPFGMNSTLTMPLEKFYAEFIKKLSQILGRRAIVTFPNNFNYKRLIKKPLVIEYEFEIYLHKSLTKKIVVLKNENNI